MIDTDKYEGHTEGPWSIRSPVSQVTKKYRGNNEGKVGLSMSDWPSYGVAGVGPCSIRRYMDDRKSEETWHANIHLVADAPLLLAEVKRLRWGIYFALSYTRPTPHIDDPWVACRESIVEHLKSLIADIEPLSFIPKGDEEE